MSRLDKYRRKRNFNRTDEPSGSVSRSRAGSRFVVHKHAARQLHYDLRLEHDGVLESWAVPKEPSMKVGKKRLAVRVEDHPLDYGEFEGTIPKKEYGGGTVMLWDRGRWRQTRRSSARIDFELAGHKLNGAWTLTRMNNGGKQEHWLLIKRSDKASVPTLPAVPRHVSVSSGRTMQQIEQGDAPAPGKQEQWVEQAAFIAGAREGQLPPRPKAQLAMLAKSAPTGPEWLHEIKFDGYRILAMLRDGDVSLWSRNGKDWTARFPVIVERLSRLSISRLLLDGEVVALEPSGLSSFRRLQEMVSTGHTEAVTYQLFDLLHVDGVDLTGAALADRKSLLAKLLDNNALGQGDVIRFTGHVQGNAESFHKNACDIGLEGIICKRTDSRYSATRNRNWLKVKCRLHEELLIGGYTDPEGSRRGFGALLLGARDARGALAYAGKVGTGFTERQLATLHARLRKLARRNCPFRECAEKKAHWVDPELIAEVAFTEWTRDGRLRHPVFRGLREDKNPEEIRMPAAMSSEAPSQPTKRKTSQIGRDNRSAKRNGKIQVAGVTLTHPDRVLYPQQGITKLDLARYYEAMADWILPQIRRRPLTLLRCPEGRGRECFFQKHPGQAISADAPRITIQEKNGKADYLYVERLPDLVALVQAGTLELHAWGARIDDIERPDMLVFDLDPGPDVPWAQVLDATRSLQDRLRSLKLHGFLRTTGGKGLHVVVPLQPSINWEQAKAFTKAVAAAHAREDTKRFTINMSKAKRKRRIFIDYLRNGRGNTAIVSYSTRAREGAPVAVPVRRSELRSSLKGNTYDVESVRRRVKALGSDPWHRFERSRRAVTPKMLSVVGLKDGTR